MEESIKGILSTEDSSNFRNQLAHEQFKIKESGELYKLKLKSEARLKNILVYIIAVIAIIAEIAFIWNVSNVR